MAIKRPKPEEIVVKVRQVEVLMGAPNLIRGGSHSGNVAAGTLAEAGLLDILSSDYVPSALLFAARRFGATCRVLWLRSALHPRGQPV